METKKVKKKAKIITIIYSVILLFSLLNVYNKTLDKKISVLGDNIYYYVLGQSLANNEGYVNTYDINKSYHNQFPPGYPVIIGFVSKFFSNDVVLLKQVNGVFLALSIALLFVLVYYFTSNLHLAFITSLYTIFNFQILYYSGIMMSEIPFLFFSFLSFFALIKIDFSIPFYKNWKFLMLIFLVAACYYIKTIGIALFAAILVFLFIKKYWQYALSFAGVFFVLVLPWQIRNSNIGGGGYMSKMMLKNIYRPEDGAMDLWGWLVRFSVNFERYVSREIPSALFNFIDISNYKESISVQEWIFGLVVLAFIIFGLIKMVKLREVILLYIVFSMGILLLWPEVWNGPRFLFTLIPIFTFLFVLGVIKLIFLMIEKWGKIANETPYYIGLSFFCLISIGMYSNESITKFETKKNNAYNPRYAKYFELAKWTGRNTPDTSLICCRKPLLFYFHSKRFVTGFGNISNEEKMIESFIDKNIDYVVYESLGFSTTARYLYPVLTKYPTKFKFIRGNNNPNTALFKFQPEYGYWGEWKQLDIAEEFADSVIASDRKYVKEGMGSYLWENDDKYEGEWQNNLRHGNGKYSTKFMGTNYLKGKWYQDSLSGINYLMSETGDTLEKRYYKSDTIVESISYDE